MKLIGALIAACAAAAVIPYRVEIDKENKTLKLKSLTYEIEATSKENGEKSVKINIFPSVCDEESQDEDDGAVMCDKKCDSCDNLFDCPLDNGNGRDGEETLEEEDEEENEEEKKKEEKVNIDQEADFFLKLDKKFFEGVELVIKEGKATVSMFQRELKIGYGRAADLISNMQRLNIISAADKQGKREVLITKEGWEELAEKIKSHMPHIPQD